MYSNSPGLYYMNNRRGLLVKPFSGVVVVFLKTIALWERGAGGVTLALLFYKYHQ